MLGRLRRFGQQQPRLPPLLSADDGLQVDIHHRLATRKVLIRPAQRAGEGDNLALMQTVQFWQRLDQQIVLRVQVQPARQRQSAGPAGPPVFRLRALLHQPAEYDAALLAVQETERGVEPMLAEIKIALRARDELALMVTALEVERGLLAGRGDGGDKQKVFAVHFKQLRAFPHHPGREGLRLARVPLQQRVQIAPVPHILRFVQQNRAALALDAAAQAEQIAFPLFPQHRVTEALNAQSGRRRADQRILSHRFQFAEGSVRRGQADRLREDRRINKYRPALRHKRRTRPAAVLVGPAGRRRKRDRQPLPTHQVSADGVPPMQASPNRRMRIVLVEQVRLPLPGHQSVRVIHPIGGRREMKKRVQRVPRDLARQNRRPQGRRDFLAALNNRVNRPGAQIDGELQPAHFQRARLNRQFADGRTGGFYPHGQRRGQREQKGRFLGGRRRGFLGLAGKAQEQGLRGSRRAIRQHTYLRDGDGHQGIVQLKRKSAGLLLEAPGYVQFAQ